MKKIWLMLILFVFLAACSGHAPVATMMPTASLSATLNPTETPTATATATATKVPIPEGLTTVPTGFSAVQNPDGTWGYGIGTEGQVPVIPGLTVDQNGAHFLLDGVNIDIPVSEIQARIKVGQEGVLQIYNEAGMAIDYAYDAENSLWIKASDVLQPDHSNTEKYVHVKTWDDLNNLNRLQKMVLSPFPADTHSWLSDKTILNYMDSSINRDPTSDYTYWRPLGVLDDLSKMPFRRVSFTLLEKGEGRPKDVYIITEQVYNPDDGSFSVLHAMNDYLNSDRFSSSPSIFNSDLYLLPVYKVPSTAISYRSESPTIDFLLNHGYLESDGSMPKIKALIDQWLTVGHFPPELEEIPFIYNGYTFDFNK